MIKARLGLVNKIPARKCEVRQIEKDVADAFLQTNHISGATRQSLFAGGLYHQNELVAVLTMRKPFTKRHQGSLEIARFATKLGTRVVGGFSKLYKHMVGVLNPESVITYSDLRFGSGRVYLEVGFVFESKTQPDYYYTDYFSRYARFQYRAQGGVSEREVAEQAGMVRIYGTGSNLYTWRRI